TLGHYVATRDASGLQIHQYAAARVAAPGPPGPGVAFRMDTSYPWDGHIRLTIEETSPEPWTLALRVPAWCEGAPVLVNGHEIAPRAPGGAAGLGADYARLDRAWAPRDVVELTLPMPPRYVEAHPWVESARSSVAIERGPLIYCLEQADHPDGRIADFE